MKKVLYLILALSALSIAACTSNNTYSRLLKKEKALISNFISRRNIHVVDTVPQVWDSATYMKLPEFDNLYFQLTLPGDTSTEEVYDGDRILVRYRKYTLEEYADTIDHWTTVGASSPTEFKYMVNSNNACTAWHYAVKYMQYSGAQCRIICPSKLGFTEDNASVTPYGYDMSILINRH